MRIGVAVFLLMFSFVSLAEEIPLDNFIKRGDYLDLVLSPDGQHLAARVRMENSVAMVFIERESGKVVGGMDPGPMNEIQLLEWVSNDRVVFDFAQRQYYLDAPIPTGEIFAVNIDGSRKIMLAGYRAGDAQTGSRISKKEDSRATFKLLNTLPGDKKNALVIEYPWSQRGSHWYDDRLRTPVIHKINIFNGKRRKVEAIPFPNASVLTTREGDVKFLSWVDESFTLRAVFRKHVEDEWTTLSEAFNLPGEMEPVGINSDVTSVFLRGPAGDKKIMTLYSLDLQSGELRQLFDGQEADITHWDIDPDSGEPVVGTSFPAKARYHYSQQQSKTVSIHKMLVKAFKGQNINITSWTEDMSHVMVRVTSDVNPGEYYLFNTSTRKANFIWANLSWIDPRDMRTMSPGSVAARDGVAIPILLTLPEQSTAEPSPLIVMIHGGPHGVADRWVFNNETQLFANRGYAVLQVNYRGSGGYGNLFEQMGFREWGGKMIDDIVDATKWATSQPQIDANRVCIYGASYGGYAAIMSAAKSPDTYHCAVGYAGVYDLKDLYSKGDIPENWGGLGYLQKVLGEDKNLLNKFSPINHAAKISAKVMLIHGGNDLRAPIQHAREMRKSLETLGKKVEWLSFPNSGHGVWGLKNRHSLYTRLLAFFDGSLSAAK